MEVEIDVLCTQLPGSRFDDVAGGQAVQRSRIVLALQRGEDLVGPVDGDARQARFRPRFEVRQRADGRPNFLGPYAKGTPDQRFFYLAWAERDAAGALRMFRRAKVHLSGLRWDAVSAAAAERRPLRVEIAMTDAKGGPRCASIHPDQAHWLD